MIKILNLTKTYGGLTALDSLSMEIAEGETLGFIGPNGAGKTTTLKILATLLNPTSGAAEIAGFNIRRQPARVREILGYMPDFCGVYEDMRVREYLHFFGAAYGLSTIKLQHMVDDVLSLTDLTEKAEAMADSLSRGMQQRLQLARVLLHDPKVLLLDEPASGLDPRARIEIRMLLQELRQMGKTIIISSHILAELAELCTSIAIIERGKLLYQGDVHKAIEQAQSMRPPMIFVGVQDRLEDACALLSRQQGISDVQPHNNRAEIAHDGTWNTSKVFEILTEHDFRLTRLDDEHADLEDAFMHLTKGKVQ